MVLTTAENSSSIWDILPDLQQKILIRIQRNTYSMKEITNSAGTFFLLLLTFFHKQEKQIFCDAKHFYEEQDPDPHNRVLRTGLIWRLVVVVAYQSGEREPTAHSGILQNILHILYTNKIHEHLN